MGETIEGMRQWLVVGLVLLLGSSAQASEWERVREEAGITSFKREGEPLPTYRARATFDASVWDAVAVLDDVDRACEWTSHCAEMRRVKTMSEREMLVYARMDAPWPVRDRDVAVHVSVHYGRAGELTIQIRDTDVAQVPTSSAVRMPTFVAHYRFQPRADQRTDVEYQLEFDPGGSLPEWLKVMVVKNLAHDTLDDLRDRVRWAQQNGIYNERARHLAKASYLASAR